MKRLWLGLSGFFLLFAVLLYIQLKPKPQAVVHPGIQTLQEVHSSPRPPPPPCWRRVTTPEGMEHGKPRVYTISEGCAAGEEQIVHFGYRERIKVEVLDGNDNPIAGAMPLLEAFDRPDTAEDELSCEGNICTMTFGVRWKTTVKGLQSIRLTQVD